MPWIKVNLKCSSLHAWKTHFKFNNKFKQNYEVAAGSIELVKPKRLVTFPCNIPQK